MKVASLAETSLPVIYKRGGIEDRREGTGKNPDEKSRVQWSDNRACEDQEREKRQYNCQTGVNGTRKRLVNTLADKLAKVIPTTFPLEVLANSIKDYNSVMDRESDNR
jgi:hypothetical protein